VIVITDPSEALRRSAMDRIGLPEQVVEVATLDDATHVLTRGQATASVVVLGPGLELEASLKFAELVERESPSVATLLIAAGPGRLGMKLSLPHQPSEPSTQSPGRKLSQRNANTNGRAAAWPARCSRGPRR
jgi:hypothetical protein